MSNLKVQGNASGSGTTTLQSPNTSVSATITLPDSTSADTLGYLNAPINEQSAAYTAVAADADSSNWVAFQGPATVTSNVTWTLPSVDGSNGQFLSTNGTGTLSWATASGGGGSATILENLQTISSNYTVTSGYNGISAGPVTVNTGVAVTVGTGQRWLILE